MAPMPQAVKRQAKKRRLVNNFKSFVEFVFKDVYKVNFYDNFHVDILCKTLQDVNEGILKDVLINIPPRYGKTEIIVKIFIAWCFVRNAACKFIQLSYSRTLVLKNSQGILNILKSSELQYLFKVNFEQSTKSKELWETLDGGHCYSVPAKGAITGHGAGHKGDDFGGALIYDDPHKASDATVSEVERQKVIDNFRSAYESRKNNPDKTPTIVIMQRLHEEDLSGYILANMPQFKHICLRALKEDGDDFPYDRRNVGDPLDSRMHTASKLADMQKSNPQVFAGEYQQRPSPAEGNIVKKSMLKYYDYLPDDLKIYYSCDLNVVENGTSNACFSCYGIDGQHSVYLIDQAVGKWSFPDALAVFKTFVSKQYEAILVEKKANGPALIASLERDGFIGIIPIDAHIKKIYRLNEVSTMYMSGKVYYPNPEKHLWAVDHINEMMVFPNGKNDDRVDCETQMLKFVRDELSTLVFYDI